MCTTTMSPESLTNGILPVTFQTGVATNFNQSVCIEPTHIYDILVLENNRQKSYPNPGTLK